MTVDSAGTSESAPLLRERQNPQSQYGSTGAAQQKDHETGDSRAEGPDGEGGRLLDGSEDASHSRPDSPVQFEGLPELRKRMKYILPAIGIGIFLSALDQTIIISSYGKIGSELRALNQTSWIATAYFVTLTSFQPLYGKLSDIFSRKSCLLFAYAVFGTGCVFCGLAPNIGSLIAARALAGIGGGGMTTVISILISDIVPLRERGKWQGYINIIYACGAGAGAPLGGLMADSIGWRWAFIFQGPLCLLAFIAVSSALKLPAKDSSNWRQSIRRIDVLGALILIAAVLLLLLGLDRGGNYSWTDELAIASLCLAVPLFVLFVCTELYIAKEPFAPGRILFDRSLLACYMSNFFAFASWMSAIFYIPLYYQVVHDRTATQAGLLVIPSIIAGVTGSLLSGIYMQRSGKYRIITGVAYTMLLIGIFLVFLLGGTSKQSMIGVCMAAVIPGFSNGIGVTTTLVALIANASRDDQALAIACSYLFRSLGSVFGISLSATVANTVLRSQLERRLPSNGDGDAGQAREIGRRIRESLAYIRTLEPQVQAIVRTCYAGATHAAFGLQAIIAVGAAVAAWFIVEKKLSR